MSAAPSTSWSSIPAAAAAAAPRLAPSSWPAWAVALVLVVADLVAAAANAEPHEDARCACKCPDVTVVHGNYSFEPDFRSMYIDSGVAPKDCDCVHVVLTHLNLTPTEADSFCPRCECKYQVRNLTIIKVVVILVIWVTAILLIYMVFLSCLEPILNRRTAISRATYQEQRDVDSESNIQAGQTAMRTYGTGVAGVTGVVQRVRQDQTRWKQQVQEQRRNIYDRHSMLN